MCDADGELFIKPCTTSEITFYESAHALHPDFSELMPLYLGSLSLSEGMTDEMIHAAIPAIVENADIPTPKKEEIQSHLHLAERPVILPEPSLQRAVTDGVTWIPSKSRKIMTDRAVVLENASFGYKKPNIMDAKLGIRLWADDAPLEKRNRFDKIATETTHMKYGFRVAGMRVYKGSTDASELDVDDYRIYDKDWGRFTVNNNNLLEKLKTFIFNEAAGIDEELGKIVAGAFASDVRRVQDVLESEESRMFSSSLLFVFEGDGEALRAAIEETSASARESVTEKASTAASGRANLRVDSGIGMGDDIGEAKKPKSAEADETSSDISDDLDEFSTMPHIYSVKLIDFAHARWTPGQGPDENVLLGVRSLAQLFEEMSQ
ncbi:inositol polyphosphate multikinase [Pseudomassariella vexata]|uniref:Kinase n=1 Tax=Pseudomassariella vexata TaxID=1141098 RepID=A0A1Y2DZT5_9PEZI|nr:inositol polyphosphate multikinase [Pseudomassariella vexata]ORY64800.1 inositol polyphosphate multikinase [Pseudomassariella vexata]